VKYIKSAVDVIRNMLAKGNSKKESDLGGATPFY